MHRRTSSSPARATAGRRARSVLRTALPLAGALALLLGPAQVAPSPGSTSSAVVAAVTVTRAKAVDRPNVVLITTDDQRADDLRWMPHTRRLLGGSGITFTEALSPHPLCCPARAELMTGQYGQNNGVHHNKGAYGGYPALRDKANTLGRWLDERGYQTAMVGKYLNGYDPDRASAHGWDHWNPTIFQMYSYTNTVFLDDGRPRRYSRHVDDVVTSYAADYVREFSRRDAPFFVWASNLAPHDALVKGAARPPVAAKRHRGTLRGAIAPSTGAASFGRRVVDGPSGRLDPQGLADHMSDKHVRRIESLQAVDEGVRDIVRTLKRTGEWRNTYVVFTSDNGYLLGEHGLVSKNYIFEEALRVPLVVRVPGLRQGQSSQVPVTIVDLAPTIADLAGVAPGRTVDGVSFTPLLTGGSTDWRDTQLIQTGTDDPDAADPGWQLRGVRTDRYTYAVDATKGTEQLYDRTVDPFQTVNLATRDEYRAVLDELRRRTDVLTSCAGAECSQSFGAAPEPEPLLSPLPLPDPAYSDTGRPGTPARHEPRVSLRTSDGPVTGRTLALTVRSPQRISFVAWQRRSASGAWRTFARTQASGIRVVRRIDAPRRPGKHRFRAVVTLSGGRATSNPVAVRVR